MIQESVPVIFTGLVVTRPSLRGSRGELARADGFGIGRTHQGAQGRTQHRGHAAARRQKHSSAEEPVTARIRRRQGTNPTTEETVEQDAEADGTLQPTETQVSPPRKLPRSFRDRIAAENRGTDLKPSLP